MPSLSLLLLLLATACGSLYQKPEVGFVGLRVGQLGLTGGRLIVRVVVRNPNWFDLDARRLTYRVTSGTRTLGTGLSDTPAHIAPHDSAVVELPVDVRYAALGDVGRHLLRGDVVDYRVAGDITIGLPVGSFTHPFEVSGEAGPAGRR